jgi:hypothetical protein
VAEVRQRHRRDGLGTTTGPGAVGTVTASSNLPQTAGSCIRAEIVAEGGPKSWAAPAHAYSVREANVWRLVGFERVPENNPPSSAVNMITDPEQTSRR